MVTFLWQLSVFLIPITLGFWRKSGFYGSSIKLCVYICEYSDLYATDLGTPDSLLHVPPLWTDSAGEGRALKPWTDKLINKPHGVQHS